MWSCVGGKPLASAAIAPEPCTGAALEEPLLLEGTVAVCGWFACTEKNLEKYAAWWRGQGWQPVLIRIKRNLDVLTLRATMRHLHASYCRLAATQAAVVQRGGSARVIFHAFSMVGWSLYSLLLREMAAAQSSPRMADVCGVVLDSTPDTAPGLRIMAAAAYTVLEGKSKSSEEMQSTATFRTLKAFFAVYARPGGSSWRIVTQINDFVKEHEAFPQLYIYSAADTVVLSSSIEAHMQRQRQRGCVVRSMRLEDSPHCGHFRSHTAQYCAAVAAFLQHDLQAVPGHQVPAPIRTAGMTMAPAAYISLAEPLGAAGAGKAEGPSTPRGACTDKAGAAAAALQPTTPDIVDGRPRCACTEQA